VAAKRKPAAKSQGFDDIVDQVMQRLGAGMPPKPKSGTQAMADYVGRKSVEAVGKVNRAPLDAAKWWYGSNPKQIAENSVYSVLPIGRAAKGAIKGGRALMRNPKVVNELIEKTKVTPKGKKKVVKPAKGKK